MKDENVERMDKDTRSPLRYQISPFDSAPISVMNALSLLLDRDETDCLLVSRIWTILLDSSYGTGKGAMGHLAHILSQEEDKTGLKTQYLSGDQVFLGPGCSLYQCLENGGSAVAKVFGKRYIAITFLTDDYLYFFDPLYGTEFPKGVEKESLSNANGKVKLSLLSEAVPAHDEEWGKERELLLLEM